MSNDNEKPYYLYAITNHFILGNKVICIPAQTLRTRPLALTD